MRYFKPKSVTWWGSVVPLACGLFMALTPVHGLADWTQAMAAAFGGATPAVLINAGLVGIGLRGAL